MELNDRISLLVEIQQQPIETITRPTEKTANFEDWNKTSQVVRYEPMVRSSQGFEV